MIGAILVFIGIAWITSTLLTIGILLMDEDVEIDYPVLFLFPANLIFVVKYWWKSIIKAIKS